MFLVSLELGGAFQNNALPYMRVGPYFSITATTRRSVFVLDTVVPQLGYGHDTVLYIHLLVTIGRAFVLDRFAKPWSRTKA